MSHAVRPRTGGRAWRPLLLLLSLIAVVLAAGCADEKTTSPVGGGDSCRSCHTSKEQLIATAAPEEEPGEDPGEG